MVVVKERDGLVKTQILFFLDCQQLSLSSSSPTNGSYCPGTVNFTCRGTDISITLNWKINRTTIGTYIFRYDTFPFFLPPTLSTPEGVELIVLYSLTDGISLQNITSMLKGNVAHLLGSAVECATAFLSSEQYYVEAQGK